VITVIVTEAKCIGMAVTVPVCVSKCVVTDTMIETGAIIAPRAWLWLSIVAIITTTNKIEDGPLTGAIFSGQRYASKKRPAEATLEGWQIDERWSELTNGIADEAGKAKKPWSS
jgi:hypothetical protein